MYRRRVYRMLLAGRSVMYSLARTSVCLLLFTLVGACTTTHYRESADKEVAGIIAQKTQALDETLPLFDVEAAGRPDLSGLPVTSDVYDFLGPEAQSEVDARILNLDSALEIGFTHSRRFQNSKEQFYLEALGLTLDRHRFAPIGGAGAAAGIAGAANGEISSNAEGRARLSRLFRSGGSLAFDLTTSFLQFVSGDPRRSVSTVLDGRFTQPLLRGRGAQIATETLTQSERDVLYALRAFARFRRTFVVEIASSYYAVLGERDAVRNNYLAVQGFRVSLERERAFAEEGLSTPAAVGRLEQEELTNQSNWLNTIRNYKQRLDNFKILLGLPTDTSLVLEDLELDRVREIGIQHPDMAADEAVGIGLETRLDLQTSRDRVDDAERRITVAANALKPGVDLVLSASVPSKSRNRPLSPDFESTQWSAGADLELPLDRKAERNAYRSALIEYDRSVRGFELSQDEVKLAVREAWRSLDQAKRNYEISVKQVELNERRVEEQDLRAELGLSNVLDQVDSRNALTAAQNQLTRNLVAHTTARLQFWRDIGALTVLENGQWEETLNVAD